MGNNKIESAKPVGRRSAEAIALAAALSITGPVYMSVQKGLADVLVSLNHSLSSSELQLLSLSMVVGSIVTVAIYERHVLALRGITHNPATVVIDEIVKNQNLAVALGTVWGNIASINMVDIYNSFSFVISTINTPQIHQLLDPLLANAPVNTDPNLFYANLISRSILGCGYALTINWIIQNGFTQETIARLEQFRQSLYDKLSPLNSDDIKIPNNLS